MGGADGPGSQHGEARWGEDPELGFGHAGFEALGSPAMEKGRVVPSSSLASGPSQRPNLYLRAENPQHSRTDSRTD